MKHEEDCFIIETEEELDAFLKALEESRQNVENTIKIIRYPVRELSREDLEKFFKID